jgi:HEAT repeat protein
MKKSFIAFAIIAALCVQVYAANEDVAVWEKIYNDVNNDEQRVSVMIRIMEFKNRDFTPILVNALDRVVSSPITSGSNTDKYNRNTLTRLLVQELGNLKSSEAMELIFRVYDENPEAVIKEEAAIALGKIRATRYAERLALDLSSINLGPKPSISRNQEIIALGLVQSLASMRAPIGYEPVFLAANGWYSSFSRVKETAASVLPAMVDDPGESIMNIITNNPSLDIKNSALAAMLASKAANDHKIEIAAAALKIAIERTANDVPTRTALARLRADSMVALTALKDTSPDRVPMYVAIIGLDKRDDASLDATLKAYVALGVNGSDDAAKFLNSRLMEFNEREKSKANSVRDKSLIRQIIASMVLTKNPIVKSSLTQAQFIDYDNNIANLVKDALSKILN